MRFWEHIETVVPGRTLLMLVSLGDSVRHYASIFYMFSVRELIEVCGEHAAVLTESRSQTGRHARLQEKRRIHTTSVELISWVTDQMLFLQLSEDA